MKKYKYDYASSDVMTKCLTFDISKYQEISFIYEDKVYVLDMKKVIKLLAKEKKELL